MFVMFYFVCKAVSSPKDVIYNTTFPYTTFQYSETKRRSEKRLTFFRWITHKNRTPATQRIILSGDIETNPKPTKKIIPSKCSRQSISVAKNWCVPTLKG